jgi:hypothetical protein
MVVRNSVLVLIAVQFVVALALVTAGCYGDAYAPISVVNTTNETLSVFIDGYNIGDVAPEGSISPKSIAVAPALYSFEARNKQGKVVYAEKFTREELEKAKWKVVITAPKQ